MWGQQLRKASGSQKSWGLTEFLHLCGIWRPQRESLPNILLPSNGSGNSAPTYFLRVSPALLKITGVFLPSFLSLLFFFLFFIFSVLQALVSPRTQNCIQPSLRPSWSCSCCDCVGCRFVAGYSGNHRCRFPPSLCSAPQRGESWGLCVSLLVPRLFWIRSYCRI